MQSVAQWHPDTCKLCVQPTRLAAWHQMLLADNAGGCMPHAPNLFFPETTKIATGRLRVFNFWIKLGPKSFLQNQPLHKEQEIKALSPTLAFLPPLETHM
jgi:hypothetical protein